MHCNNAFGYGDKTSVLEMQRGSSVLPTKTLKMSFCKLY